MILKVIIFLAIGILLSLFLITVFENIGIMIIVGLGLGSLFTIIYQLSNLTSVR